MNLDEILGFILGAILIVILIAGSFMYHTYRSQGCPVNYGYDARSGLCIKDAVVPYSGE